MNKILFAFVAVCIFVIAPVKADNHGHKHNSECGYEHSDVDESDANIIGHVLDANTNEYLPYITVTIKSTTIGTTTDAAGHYFLKHLPEGEFELEVSSMGYISQSRKVTSGIGREF